MHNRSSSEKQRAKVLMKRGNEVLCKIDMLEPTVEWIEEEDVEQIGIDQPIFEDTDNEQFPVIQNLSEWLVSPFVPEKDI